MEALELTLNALQLFIEFRRFCTLLREIGSALADGALKFVHILGELFALEFDLCKLFLEPFDLIIEL